ncbi:MAG: hypothetical protein WAU68_17400 [Vitreimonas sp.]
MRFGVYQLIERGECTERGFFYDSDNDVLSAEEIDTLRREAPTLGHKLITRDAFVHDLLFGVIEAGGTIAGFNLPFDLSRIAIGAVTARRTRNQHTGELSNQMQDAFTFELSRLADMPRLQIKHQSKRAAFIRLTSPGDGTPRSERRKGRYNWQDRGYFLDAKTLGSAMLGQSVSLASLTRLLGTPTKKTKLKHYGGPLDRAMLDYAARDVQATRECLDELLRRYASHTALTRLPHKIYSEASLGKAYLEAMGVQPLRSQPPDLLGTIMSTYFGGRAEVRLKCKIAPTLYCDFNAMYPTVCTLMQLWPMLTATGVECVEDAAWAQRFLEEISLEQVRDPGTWKSLTAIVCVEPDADIFPVRARYGGEGSATIGINYLSSEQPLWFTLADCVASKILTGKAPKVIRALRFKASKRQDGLKPVDIAGRAEFRVDPQIDDFICRLIQLRRDVKRERSKFPKHSPEWQTLDAEQQGLKLLANSTSYGIFVELNPNDREKPQATEIFHGSGNFSKELDFEEQPGPYFHPLLATVTTGGARLMLAIAEQLANEAGLDWIFCDTDSMAFARPDDMPETGFVDKVSEISNWFCALNPYGETSSIFELQDENKDTDTGKLEPLFCYAVSDKRYALFNANDEGEIIIRKASAHGLGYLYPPYDDGLHEDGENSAGVLQWQEDLWREIVCAAQAQKPNAVKLDWRGEMKARAASRYGVSKPSLLRAFARYNEGESYTDQIKPFNFMLWFHARKVEDVARLDPALADWASVKPPKPAAPFDDVPARAVEHVFDRETFKPVDPIWLKTYAEILRGYGRHAETKFLGGEAGQSGVLERRHIRVNRIWHIGKEADRWEEDEDFGAEVDSVIQYGLSPEERLAATAIIREVLRFTTQRELSRASKVSEHTLQAALAFGDVTDAQVARLRDAAEVILALVREDSAESMALLDWARSRVEIEGRNAFALRVGVDGSNIAKVLAGERACSEGILTALRAVRGEE